MIYLTSTNRFAFWCRLLKESMSGMGTNQQLLIRVLITRSEIDLGEISSEFSRKQEHGGGKTLKQWLRDATKGSFQHLLLRVAGLFDDESGNDDNKADSEQSVETSVESGGNLLHEENTNNTATGSNETGPGATGAGAGAGGGAAGGAAGGGTMATSVPSPGIGDPSETGDYRVKIIAQQSASNYNDLDQNTQPSMADDSVVGTLTNMSSHGSAAEDELKATDLKAKEPKDPELVDIGDMGSFMLGKMTDKTVNKLWTHIDESGSGLIGHDEVLSLMTFTAVLYNAYKQRVNKVANAENKKLDKNKIRKHLTPLCNWIGTTKMVNDHKQIGKQDFTKLFGKWLQEYAANQSNYE